MPTRRPAQAASVPPAPGPLDNLADLSLLQDPLAGTGTVGKTLKPQRRRSGPSVDSGVWKVLAILAAVAGGIGGLVALVVMLFNMSSSLGGHSSPQAVFDAYHAAMRARKWGAMYDTLTPESQNLLASTMCIFVSEVSQIDSKLAEIAKRHGLQVSTGQNRSPTAILQQMQQLHASQIAGRPPVKDPEEFFMDVMSVVDEKMREMGRTPTMPEVSLSELDITDDTARGVQLTKIGAQQRKLPIHFRRINGSWYIDARTNNPMALGMPTADSSQ